MRDVIDAVPAADTVKTGVSKPKEVAKGLSEALADTYRLMLKTHAYHWNVEGPLFFQLHKLTEMQYANLFAAADEIAERMRALGQLTPSTFDEIGKLSALKDAEKLPSALNMVEELANDHEKAAKRLHAIIDAADKAADPVTADLLTARSAFHEKSAWMLRATTKAA